uniref:SH3 domain-containing protein n=1 Tax=Mesocestoides corti TaxID=53468 RepID=A0A5K3FTA6_MESCO
MTSSDGGIGAPVWWRGFRLANGPNGGIGVFPSSHVTLLQSPTCTRPFLPHSAQPAKKSD